MKRLLNWFKSPDDTTVWITPYTALYSSSCEIKPELKKTVGLIAEKLAFYQDRMVDFGKKANSTLLVLQQISANYTLADNSISLYAHGSGNFKWCGSLEEFLGDKAIIKDGE